MPTPSTLSRSTSASSKRCRSAVAVEPLVGRVVDVQLRLASARMSCERSETRDPEMGVTEVDTDGKARRGIQREARRPSPGLPMRHAGRLPCSVSNPSRSDRRRCSRRWNGRDRWRALSRPGSPCLGREGHQPRGCGSIREATEAIRSDDSTGRQPYQPGALSRLRTNSFKKGQQLSGDRTKPRTTAGVRFCLPVEGPSYPFRQIRIVRPSLGGLCTSRPASNGMSRLATSLSLPHAALPARTLTLPDSREKARREKGHEDLPTSAQLASLSPVAAFLTSKTSRSRSLLSRFQGRPRRCRTMPAKSRRSLSLRFSYTRSRELNQRISPLPTQPTGLRDRVPGTQKDTFSPLVVVAPTALRGPSRPISKRSHPG